MRILVRYLVRELLTPLVAWLGFMFLLLFLMQFLKGSDVLLGSAVRFTDVVRLLAYLAPHFLVMALPIAFLLALLLGLGRLAEDRELTALAALGVSPAQLVVIPLLLGLLLSGVMMGLAFTLEPNGLAWVKVLAGEVIKRNVAGDVKPGVFYTDLSQLTLYAEDADPKTGRWHHVLIHDDRDPASPLLVLAKDGQVVVATEGEALRLRLRDGHVHRASRAAQDAAIVGFESGEIAVGLQEATWNKKSRFRSPKEEMTPTELLAAAEDAKERGESPLPFLTLFHTRLGNALSPIAFALLGAPLAMGRGRGGRARGLLVTLLAYASYYVVYRLLESLAAQGKVPLLVAGQLPNVLFATLGLVALWKVTRTGTVLGG